MRRVLLALLGSAALALPGAAGAAACSPLNCAPSQFGIAHGTLLGYRASALGQVKVVDLKTGERQFTLPGGFVGGDTLVHKAGLRLGWYDATTGKRTHTITLKRNIRFAGVSQDGSRAVGFR
jgi:hypothetical protein